MSVINASGVSYKNIVAGLDLRVDAGEKIGIVGASGAGKTTVLKLLAGAITPTAGTITTPPPGSFSYIPQDLDGSLNPRHRVATIITEPIAIAAGRAAARRARTDVPDLLARLDLDPGCAARRPAQLSGGQRQRVGIARALISRPRVIFADEATSALDSDTAGIITGLLRRAGVTVLLASHNPAIIASLCPRVLRIDAGRVTS